VEAAALRRLLRADGEAPASFFLIFYVDSQPAIRHL